jgi:Family of unknown function (DUF6328)
MIDALASGRGHRVMSPSESKSERLDRELAELLQELRIILPGVQVLFAFLLTVPFSMRFADTNDLQRSVFFVALLATALSSIFAIAPTAQHRLRWRRFDKEHLLRSANRLTVAATVMLGVAIDAAVFLVTDFIYDDAAAIAVATVVGLGALGLWYVLPLRRQLAEEDRGTATTGSRQKPRS